jgi:ATP-dependent Clp protease, protease subunit
MDKVLMKNYDDTPLEALGAHLIFGEIDTDSMRDAITFLLKANTLITREELTFHINSSGGSCTDGFALIDMIDISRLPIRTVSSGNIMSMGVLIACAGHKGRRFMTRNTEIMAHQYSWETDSAKYHELVAMHRAQELLAHKFIQHFLRHSTMTEAQIKDVMFGPSDKWLTPQECKKFGLIDIIIDELPPLAAPPSAQLSNRPAAKRTRTVQRKKR